MDVPQCEFLSLTGASTLASWGYSKVFTSCSEHVMSLLLFPLQFLGCILCVTGVRLYLFPTCVIAPFIRSRFDFVREEALYCAAEHGSRSGHVARAVLSQLLASSREVEREAARALPKVAPGLSRAMDALPETLVMLGRRGDKQDIMRELAKSAAHFGKKGVMLIPALLSIAHQQGSDVARELRNAACTLLISHKPAGLSRPLLEQLLLEVSRSLLAEDYDWESRWLRALGTIATHLVELDQASTRQSDSLARLQNELGLMLFQHPKARATGDIGKVLDLLRGASDA